MSATDQCDICGASHWLQLPPLKPAAMASDGRIVPYALSKMDCLSCGVARAVEMPSADQLAALFSHEYALYAHPIGQEAEDARQGLYARWIMQILGHRRPNSIFEIGCGNGSLLRQIRQRLPQAALAGLEPASSAVAFGRQAGLDIREGFLTDQAVQDLRAELVLAVNVIEHVAAPHAFLKTLRQVMAPDGIGIVICPNGNKVSTELLIYDHLRSYSRLSLRYLFQGAGLTIDSIADAPAALGDFHAVLFSVATSLPPAAGEDDGASPAQLHKSRRDYLSQWQVLETTLLARLGANEHDIACFGTGETAGLLAVYAPSVWRRVHHCIVDQASSAIFCGKPVIEYGKDDGEAGSVLLGCRPSSQPYLAKRLAGDGYSVLRWDDLISA